MATFADGIKPFPLVRPKHLLFAILAFMLVYVVVRTTNPLGGGCCHMASPARALCCWARCSSPTDFAIVLGGSIVLSVESMSQVCSRLRRSAFTSSTSRSAWAIPDLSVLPLQWTPRCG